MIRYDACVGGFVLAMAVASGNLWLGVIGGVLVLTAATTKEGG